MHPRYPLLYQVNTRVWLTSLSRTLGRRATLDDIPDAALDEFASQGFDWIWMLSVWQTGLAGQQVSRTNPQWRHEFEETLPDLCDDDIPGSGFAITAYHVHHDLGGDEALARLRARLAARGLKLMLDFVPNHTGIDHHWVSEHPEFYIEATEADLESAPQNYLRLTTASGDRILAYGRDPYFSGWPDTLQLDYSKPATQAAMTEELLRISRQCDGVRCDMAMLVLPEIFERTWGHRAPLFWPHTTELVRSQTPNFCFMAEVYWDLEWELQQQGFDYTYDKRLYDRLRDHHQQAVRLHLLADLDFQDKLARFLENHDEPRVAATFPLEMHRAAAAITFFSPGLRFLHQGQLEGKQKRISPHLGRGPEEATNPAIQEFYRKILELLKLAPLREGNWQLLESSLAWEGNPTHESMVVFGWELDQQLMVIAVNYADHASQCHARLPWNSLAHRSWKLADQMNGEVYDWQGDDLLNRGLYLDQQPWQVSVFLLSAS